ncbi:carbohydrate ABC transporter permease [Bacillus sp. N9]
MEEAAIIDGCGPFKVFWKVMLPLAKPGLISAAIFNFVGIWNEYILALILISDDGAKTLPLKLANIMMVQQYRTDWGALYAGLVLSFIPVTIFYLIFQKRLIEGSTAGSVKE